MTEKEFQVGDLVEGAQHPGIWEILKIRTITIPFDRKAKVADLSLVKPTPSYFKMEKGVGLHLLSKISPLTRLAMEAEDD